MRGLPAFIMRGRLSALGVVLVASVVPLLAWLAGAAVALVTLRRGPREGLLLVASAAAALAALLGLAFGSPLLVTQPLLELWLPVVLLAAYLRATVSISGGVRLAGLLAASAVLALHLAVPDQAAYWDRFLSGVDPFVLDGSEQTWRLVRARLLPVMAALVVLTQLALVLGSLLLGRWWQALLYNPGGFGEEFRRLDLGRVYALAAAVALAAARWQGPGLVYDVALIASAVFVLQALALAHAAVNIKGLGRGWLLALYLLLPFVFELLVVAGIADAVFDWRRRLRERADRGGPA